MKNLLKIAWDRFSVNSAIVADINGRFIATAFYFTIMVPFGLLSSIFMDPLRRKSPAVDWSAREPASTDIASAREQG